MATVDPRLANHSDPPRGLQAIGRYRVLRLLGTGGMSEVFLAYDGKSGQPVAIKLMSDRLAHDPMQLERFERETILSKRLSHPNIARGLDSGRDPGTKRRFLVLEYIDGPSALMLFEKQRRLEINDVVHIALAIGKALEYMHARHFIHRDVKPDNILLSPCGEAKLIDVGLARWEEIGGSALTATSDGFGTSYYMPLEQALNAHFVDPRSDIFALGATLYHLLCGRVPFPGDDHREVTRMKEVGVFTPVSLMNPLVSAELEMIINKMLARDPRQRWQCCSDMLVALQRARLTSGLPSYANLGQAVRDPEPKEKPTGKATRPDMRLQGSRLKKSAGGNQWIVRFEDQYGRWTFRKATTEQLLRALRQGRFPGPVHAARGRRHRFRPVADFPEFRSHFAALDKPAPRPLRPLGFCRRVLARLGLGL